MPTLRPTRRRRQRRDQAPAPGHSTLSGLSQVPSAHDLQVTGSLFRSIFSRPHRGGAGESGSGDGATTAAGIGLAGGLGSTGGEQPVGASSASPGWTGAGEVANGSAALLPGSGSSDGGSGGGDGGLSGLVTSGDGGSGGSFFDGMSPSDASGCLDPGCSWAFVGFFVVVAASVVQII
jgi:hypothetical protein